MSAKIKLLAEVQEVKKDRENEIALKEKFENELKELTKKNLQDIRTSKQSIGTHRTRTDQSEAKTTQRMISSNNSSPDLKGNNSNGDLPLIGEDESQTSMNRAKIDTDLPEKLEENHEGVKIEKVVVKQNVSAKDNQNKPVADKYWAREPNELSV